MLKQLILTLAFFLTVASQITAASNKETYADVYQKNLNIWHDFTSKNQWGNSEDYWLEKNTSEGWEKVALVMGYWNDLEGCEDIKATLETKYPRAQYRCIPANKK